MPGKFVRGSVAAVALLTIQAAAHAASDQPVRILHHQALQLTAQATASKQASTGSTMSFEAFGRQFDLELEDNVRLLEGLRAKRQVGSQASLYQGKLAGNENSWARITTIDGQIYGLVFDGEELYAIEPNRDIARLAVTPPDATEGSSIYRLSDTIAEAGAAACGVADASAVSGASAFQALSAELAQVREVAFAEGATLEIDVGLVADFEFFSDKGANSEAELLARINNVDGIFSSQLSVQINPSEITIFEDANDPFTSSDPETLLNELSAFRSANMTNPGLVHLYTGRGLDGATIGVAFVNALCSIPGGVGVSEGNGGVTFDSLIAAHELGHNFGAGHDGDAPCQNAGNDFLMAPAINGSSTFSQCSLDSMATPIAQANCITELVIADANALLGFSTLTANFDIAFDYNLTVNSVGMEEMQNVVADITLPSGITVQSSTAEGGSCTTGAGQASCALGNIPGNASRAITLNLLASVVGTFDTSVTISADNDENGGNDSSSGTLVIEPAVDLAILNLQGASSVEQNQSTSITATVSNQTAISASDVEVTVDVPDGLTASDATPSVGSCDVQDDSVSCQPGDLAADATMTIAVTLQAGEDLGEAQVSFAVSGPDLETDPGNNSALATVEVVEPPPPPDSGGGGASSLLWALCLLPLAARRRRAKARIFSQEQGKAARQPQFTRQQVSPASRSRERAAVAAFKPAADS